MKTQHLFLCMLCCASMQIYAQGPSSRTEAKIDAAYEEYGLSGNGVLAVVMDRGIDYTHPDFIDKDGKTRIAYIFDLYDNTGANDPDNPYGLGTIFDETEINEALQIGGDPIVTDIFGHGTATTGIVAGNGGAIQDSALFRGVAFNSKIISIIITKDYVPPFNGNPGQAGQYNPAVLATAFEFAAEKIEELGMPSVTLMNIGSIGQPTDGSIGLCEEIDNYTQKGHPFVCGVGDDGGQDNHVAEQLTLNETTTFEIQKGEVGSLRYVGWYDDDVRCQLTIERPDGNMEGPFDPPQNANDSKDSFLDQINIYHRGANVEFENSSSNLRMLMIDFTGATGLYKVHLETTDLGADNSIHGMLNPSRYYNDNKFVNFSTPGGNINGFSSCLSAISPTDYVANNSYVDIDGIVRTHTGQGEVGELWIGSSVGPTMDDRLGVDIASPGELAVGAYSLDSYYSDFSWNIMENSEGHYGIQNAVSGAAPIVTGVIALMLEADPELSPSEIRLILQETAREDSFTGTTANPIWGYGKLDAFEAIKKVYSPVKVDDIIKGDLSLIVSPNPFENEISISLVESNKTNVHIRIYSTTGSIVYEGFVSTGNTLNLQDLNKGIYFLQAEFKEGVVQTRILKL